MGIFDKLLSEKQTLGSSYRKREVETRKVNSGAKTPPNAEGRSVLWYLTRLYGPKCPGIKVRHRCQEIHLPSRPPRHHPTHMEI